MVAPKAIEALQRKQEQGISSNGNGNGNGLQEDEEEGEELGARKRTLACIFKVGDDVRQDVLALQVIGRSRKIRGSSSQCACMPRLVGPLLQRGGRCKASPGCLVLTFSHLPLHVCPSAPQVIPHPARHLQHRRPSAS